MSNPQPGRRTALVAAAAAFTATTAQAQDEPGLLFTVPQPTVPIGGSNKLFPVRRIYCTGSNYAAQARIIGADPSREPPFFFQKPADAIQVVRSSQIVDHPYPTLTNDYHHAIGLVAALGRGGRAIPVEQALDLVFGYALMLDMTRRDLQHGMIDQKRPWEIGKSFDRSAPIGTITSVAERGHLDRGPIWLNVNGIRRQRADLSQMVWTVAEQISQLSQAFELMPGDLIFSGTPDGTGPVLPNDNLICHIDGLPNFHLRVTG